MKKVIVGLITILLLIDFFSLVSAVGDSDEDGMDDSWEEENGLDPNDPEDAQEDPDLDGLSNFEEYKYNTDPNSEDTDSDGLTDSEEIEYQTDPNDDDSDCDGFSDAEEVEVGTDPIRTAGSAEEIRVIIIDENNENIEGVNINISGDKSFEGTTNSKGSVVFHGLSFGTYIFTITKDGYKKRSETVTISDNDDYGQMTFELNRPKTESKKDDSPGFSTILLLGAFLVVIFIIAKKNRA